MPQIGHEGQARIAAARALLIGVGGIGCSAAQALAAAGIGELILVDFDTVDETNLARQVLYSPQDLGKLKCEVAAERLAIQNPALRTQPLAARLDGQSLAQQVASADVVLDCSDNFGTRFAVSDACVHEGQNLVTGAAIRFEGQLSVFGPDYREAPCYRCLYSEADETLDNCAGNGVLGPVPGIIGGLMAVEALKLVVGLPVARGLLSIFDGQSGDWQRLAVKKRQNCPGCANV